MTAIVKANGELAENAISGNEPEAFPEVYDMLNNNKNVAYSIANETGDPDAEKWAHTLNNIQVSGYDLGKAQGVAVETPLSHYKDKNGFTVVPHETPTELESEIIQSGNVLENMNGNTWWNHPNDVQCPISSDGEKLPAVVLTNDANPKVPTYEEAVETLLGVLKRIPQIDIEDVSLPEENSSNDSSNPSNSSGSTNNSLFDPTTHKGIGEKTINKINEAGFEVRATEEAMNNAEVPSDANASDNFYDGDSVEIQGGMVETITPDLTSQNVRDRFEAVKDDLDEMDTEIVKQRIIDGDLQDAVDTIEKGVTPQ